MTDPVYRMDADGNLVALTSDELTAFEAAPAPTTRRVTSISPRQFYQQLAAQGIISETEAVAAVAGTIPAELMSVINALPSVEQFPAKMKVSGATQFLLSDPITLALSAAYGWSASQTTTFWTAASAL